MIDAPSAASRLGVSRARLYQLRAGYLGNKPDYQPKASGGARRDAWPPAAVDFLKGFLPLQSPPNYQLVAGELERLCDFKRARSTVESYDKTHLSELVPTPSPRKRTYRRFRRAHVGELWQHDSSTHQWWPSARKQTLLLTVDDCSGLYVGGRFVESDTTWNHFLHFRESFERHGLPEAIYTDGLSLFGPSSSHDHADPRSEFQRALRALHVAHLVAPTPQVKGKIERSFRTFQNRLVTLFAHAGVSDWKDADPILQMEIQRQNRTTLRTTGKVPSEVWEEQQLKRTARLRPTPEASLLDLHLSLRATRKVHTGPYIEFDGQSYEIAPTARKVVPVLFHPFRKLWVLEHSPKSTWPTVLGHFALKSASFAPARNPVLNQRRHFLRYFLQKFSALQAFQVLPNEVCNRVQLAIPKNMKLLLIASALSIFIHGRCDAEIGIISPFEVVKMIEKEDAKTRPVILDTRGGYKDYFRGHIPGAHHINFDTLRGTDAGIPVQYLPPDLTRQLLIRAGADKDRTHIIYATGEKLPNDEILSASMVAFVLEKYGIENIRIVNGGLPDYKTEGFPVSQDYYGNAPGKLPADGKPGIAIGVDELIASKDQPGFVLVDARPINEYRGEDDIWVRKGHIPGAVSFHWARLMDKENNTHRFKSFEEVKTELEAAGITPEKQVIAYCGTSREGSLLRFYLKYVAGYPNVRLYEGAWKEYAWIKNKSLPVEAGSPTK